MADTLNTEVVEDETASMSFELKVGEESVTVKVSGYAQPIAALRALYLLGQPERLSQIAASVDAAEAEHFGL